MFFKDSSLKDLSILVIDDEPNILDAVEDELEMCFVHKTSDYETAMQYLLGYKYDIVILDIMGIKGFELLKASISQEFQTVVFTAYALTEDVLKKSIHIGTVFFFPKDRLSELKDFLEKLFHDKGKSSWMGIFYRFEQYFTKHFGPDWKERDKFFQEFEESFMRSKKE